MLILNPATGEIRVTDDPSAYFEQGWREPTPDESAHQARNLEFGGFEQQAQAQAERVVRGATLGAVTGFGSDEENQARADTSEELSPITSFAASAAPDIALSAISGGAAGLATGAGRAAGRAALAEGAGLVTAGLRAAAAGGAGALAAESAASGAITAGQQAYSEGREFGEDPGRDAENALLWGGLSFGLGAFALGRQAKGVAKVAEEGGSELEDAAKAAEFRARTGDADGLEVPTTPIADSEISYLDGGQPSPFPPASDIGTPAPGAVRQGEREAVDDGFERAVNNASKANADDIVDKAVSSEPAQEADSFGRQRRLYQNRDAIFDVATREMQGDLSELVENVGEIARQDKRASVASNVSDNFAAQRSVAEGVTKDAAEFAGQLRAEAKAYGSASGKKGAQYAIPGQKSWTMALMDHAQEIEKQTTSRGLFESLDNFKGVAQDFKLSLESGALNSSNPIHHQNLIPKIDAFANRIRVALEDPSTWGRAGEMQRAYNTVISDRLLPSMKVFEESVLERTHRGYDGMWKMEGWENKISSLLKNSDPGRRRHVFAVLDAMDELAGVGAQFGEKNAPRISEGVAKVRRTIGLADEVTDASTRMQALGDLVSGGGPMSGAVAGGLAGGLPGAAVGAAVPGFARQFVMGDLISNIQKLIGATDAAATRGVDDWIASSRVRAGFSAKLPKLPEISAEAKQIGELAAKRGISHAMALFQGEDETPTAAFERTRDALTNDQKFFEYLGQDYRTLREQAPETFMVLSARAALAQQFLKLRMPPNVAVSMAHPEGYPPNRDAIEDWSHYVNAVRYPRRVAENISSARVQEVETLRTVYPRFYETIQQRAIEGMARAGARGEKLDDSLMLRMGVLFPDADGIGSPVFSKKFGQAVIDYNAQQAKPPGQSGGGGAPRPQAPGPAQAIAQTGATFGTQ